MARIREVKSRAPITSQVKAPTFTTYPGFCGGLSAAGHQRYPRDRWGQVSLRLISTRWRAHLRAAAAAPPPSPYYYYFPPPPLPCPPFPKNPEKFQPYQRAKMDTIRSLLTVKPAPPSKDATDILESQFEAQTTRLRDIHKAQRPKNTTKQYKPKQKEWEEWCARLPGNTDGAWVTEDKLCLFLEQEVINRESRAAGYQQ